MAKDFLSDDEMAALEGAGQAKDFLTDEEMAALESPSQEPAPLPGQGGAAQTALESFGDTATLGYLPQLQAMAEKPMAKVMDLVTGNDVAEHLPDYVDRRDENIARQEAQSKAHPYASAAGTLAGVGVSAALPGMGAAKLAKGASLATKIGTGAAQGAATGALYNPGDEKGVQDTFQVGKRAGNAALGAATGGLMAGAGAGVSRLAEKHRMIDRVKDSAGLSKSVKSEIDSALNKVTEKQVAPKADKLKELLQGKSVEVNPERLRGISPGLDNLASKMSGKVNEEGRRQMSATRAQRLKQLLDGRAQYGASKPFDNTAVAKGETAQKAADIVRRKLSDLDPQVGKLNDEMGEAIRLRNALRTKSASAPISAIRGEAGTDRGSLIDAVDKMAGSKLERLSGDIEDARKTLFKPSNIAHPLMLPGEALKAGKRAAGRTARIVEPATGNESLQAILQMIMEGKK
jgi:hypothetical protein